MDYFDDSDYDSGYDVYDGDTEHDMWVDYTTDTYEDTDYTGENPDPEDYPPSAPRPAFDQPDDNTGAIAAAGLAALGLVALFFILFL